MPGTLFIVNAPSGAGKTALVETLLSRIAHFYPIKRVVTYTSRAPRTGEVNGRDYCFITPVEFERSIERGFFLEWSNDYGHYYGSPSSIKEQLAQDESFIVIVDRQGMAKIKQQIPQAITIGIQVSSLLELEKRLFSRSTELPEQIRKRILLAQEEIMQESYEPLCEFSIKNDDFTQALEIFHRIVVGALSRNRGNCEMNQCIDSNGI